MVGGTKLSVQVWACSVTTVTVTVGVSHHASEMVKKPVMNIKQKFQELLFLFFSPQNCCS